MKNSLIIIDLFFISINFSFLWLIRFLIKRVKNPKIVIEENFQYKFSLKLKIATYFISLYVLFQIWISFLEIYNTLFNG
jgi:hypothetical protein